MSNLDLRFECGDLGREVSIREYLYELLATLWQEGEGFSGKRPFGNSGWDYDLFEPLIRAGVINGELDPGGGINEVDEEAGYKEVHNLIRELCGVSK